MPCPDLPDDGKIILIRTQSEPERSGHRLTRDETANYRVYEVAGVAHAPEPLWLVGDLGVDNQNPANWQPVAKAMLHHLVGWIADGNEPPPPLYLDDIVDGDGGFRLATDADGNALGGIRLPHMASVLPNGDRAGAPLGVYGGLGTFLEPQFGYAWAGGTFEPFSPEELARRYPTQDIYVDLVRKAAAALIADGYILEEDYDAYIKSAQRQNW